ncbi:MAG TPA: GGDEF domain-containing protein [Candidatus Acidoferrales bacterium]|nr:GGDEF domain-containing protein [Candidatus Acidoferrales bacterium]
MPGRGSRSRLRAIAASHALAIWITVQVGLAMTAIIGVAAAVPLRTDIALPVPGLPGDIAVPAGMAFWLAFGLVGGVRARVRPIGAFMTFSMPFIVTGTMLGGPLAGGLMGLVSELELREIRTQPWYGTLSNHAVAVTAAVVAGYVGPWVRSALAPLLSGQDQLAFFVAAIATTIAFATVNLALVIPTLALRHHIGLRQALRTQDAFIRTTTLAEGVLAWNMAAGYLLLGWWAPIASAGLVLIVWQAFDRGEALHRDPKTGLLNDAGLEPRLNAALDRARTRHRGSALLLLDLDHFKAINDTYLYEAGDEVLLAVSRRLLNTVRALDAVARMNRAGDEFGILLDDVGDEATARLVAERVQAAVARPMRLRTVDVEVSVNVSIGIALIEPEARRTGPEVFDLADARMLLGKSLGSGIVSAGEDGPEALARRRAAKPRRETSPDRGAEEVVPAEP